MAAVESLYDYIAKKIYQHQHPEAERTKAQIESLLFLKDFTDYFTLNFDSIANKIHLRTSGQHREFLKMLLANTFTADWDEQEHYLYRKDYLTGLVAHDRPVPTGHAYWPYGVCRYIWDAATHTPVLVSFTSYSQYEERRYRVGNFIFKRQPIMRQEEVPTVSRRPWDRILISGDFVRFYTNYPSGQSSVKTLVRLGEMNQQLPEQKLQVYGEVPSIMFAAGRF